MNMDGRVSAFRILRPYQKASFLFTPFRVLAKAVSDSLEHTLRVGAWGALACLQYREASLPYRPP
jgi:hypothetical protein